MNLCGLTDSLATLRAAPNECPRCHAQSRIGHDLCLGCLLRSGTDDGENLAPDEFDAALAAIAVPDAHWRLGNYEILEEIGRGGMGVIYRARQRHSRRIVALKRVLSYHADSRETLARFRREAEAAASLDHPNILPIYEVGESEDGVPYFSMKYASGGSLQEVGPALRDDPREIVHLLAKVTRAVQYANRQGILHRDLKPGNILLDGRGEPLVSDFGLAKWLDSSSDITRTLTIFGTPGYIAPEQAEGPAANLKPTADIYSLGAILFDLLAGRPPFLGEHALAVIHQAAEKPAPKLRSLVRNTDRDLEIICARCLEREPPARYRSAGDLAEDLERWLEGRPIIARPVSLPICIWRYARRNPVVVSSIAAVLLLLLLALGRQIKTRRLADELYGNEMAARSVAVIPLLDLDRVEPAIDVTRTTADGLAERMAELGPSRATYVSSPGSNWTGIANADQVRTAAQSTGCRTIITGTVRQLSGKKRFSFHLIQNSGETLSSWIREIDDNKYDAKGLLGERASVIYSLLQKNHPASGLETLDPALSNPTSRAYLNVGRDLLDRRTILDMDRAVTCFAGAIDAAPRSVLARSYFAMACVGRNNLAVEKSLLHRGLDSARQAVALAPDSAFAQRGLCAAQTGVGRFHEALESGFRALEAGDPTERAFAQIAYIWKCLGRPDLAIAWYEKAKVSENQPDYYSALQGDCWLDLLEESKATDAYHVACRFRPDWPEGWLGLCQIKLLQGDFGGARSLYREHARDYEGFPVALQMGAHIEFFSRNYREADALYSKLEESDPGGTGAQQYGAISNRSVLARIAQTRGDNATAHTLIEKCLQADRAELDQAPDNAELFYRLAAEEAVAGEKILALDHLQKALQAGWLDWRSLARDPRFDGITSEPRFSTIVQEAKTKVDRLRRRSPAVYHR